MLNIEVSLNSNPFFLKGGFIMKKIAIEILIAAATVMAYVLPVLAEGGGC
jgi:hypothetical protein